MLKIDRNLYSYSQVKEVINFINNTMITGVKVHLMDEQKDKYGIKYTDLYIKFDTLDMGRGIVPHSFYVNGLITHNANVLAENITEYLQ